MTSYAHRGSVAANVLSLALPCSLAAAVGLVTFAILRSWSSRPSAASVPLFAGAFVLGLLICTPLHARLRRRLGRILPPGNDTNITLSGLLTEMGRSSDLVQLVGRGLETVVRDLGLSGASLFFAPDDRQDFVLADARGTRPVRSRLAFDDPVVEVVAATRAHLTREALHTNPRYAHVRDLSLETLDALGVDAMVPVEAGGRIVGLTALRLSDGVVSLDPTEVELLQTMTAEIGLCVVRTRDTERLRRARRETERLARFLPRAIAGEVPAGRLPGRGGRRRNVTVLVCAIDGLDHLAEDAEPQALGSTISRYHAAATAEVGREGGTLARAYGGHVVAVFGDPDPVSDHARRATRMAVRLARAARALGHAHGSIDRGTPVVSVGVATGFATVGFVSGGIGPAYHVAGKLVRSAEALARAAAGTVLISERTAAASGDRLSGKPVPLPQGATAWRVEEIDGFDVS